MNAKLKAIFDQTLEAAAAGLFEHLGVNIAISDAEETGPHEIACSIGFASPTLRGSLTLTTERGFVASCRPVELRAAVPTDAELSDWTGELANQLLGRFKNRLLLHGVPVEIGTPAVLYGFHIQRRSGKLPFTSERHVRSAHGILALHVDARISEAFVFEPAEREADVMPEGELALF